MTQYTFGSGTVIAKRTDLLNTAPQYFGVLQDIEVDLDQSLKQLVGQYKVAIDIAPGELKISGKAKFARIQANTIGNMFLGVPTVLGAGQTVQAGEQQTPSGGGFIVANGSTFIEDLGVFYTSYVNGYSGPGAQLQPVASSPAVGQYIPGSASSGAYTTNSSDNGRALTVFYSYTVNTLQQVSLSNQLMGTGPVFEVVGSAPYSVQGVAMQFNFRLNACRSQKLSMPMKNQDYLINSLDFMASADAFGNIASWWVSAA